MQTESDRPYDDEPTEVKSSAQALTTTTTAADVALPNTAVPIATRPKFPPVGNLVFPPVGNLVRPPVGNLVRPPVGNLMPTPILQQELATQVK